MAYKVLHIVTGDFLNCYTQVSVFSQKMTDAIFPTRAKAGQAIKQYRLNGFIRPIIGYKYTIYVLPIDVHKANVNLAIAYMGSPALEGLYFNRAFLVRKETLHGITQKHKSFSTFEREVWCKQHKVTIPSKQEFIIVEI